MTDACTSPGSRSSPLVLALARDPAAAGVVARGRAVLRVLRARPGQGDRPAGRRHGHVGHRGGRAGPGRARGAGGPGPPARADGRPPGGAARGRRRPDDRPAQALRIGGEVVLRGGDAGPTALRALACRAYWTSLEGRPGVVHLNFPLREPLVPDGALPDDPSGRADGAPMLDRAEVDQIPVPAALERLIEAVETRPRRDRGRALGAGPRARARRGGAVRDDGLPRARRPAVGRAAPRRVGRPLRHAAARRGLRRRAFPRAGDPRRRPADEQAVAGVAGRRGRAADRAHARRRGPGPRRRGRPLGSGRSRADARRAQRTRHARARRRLGGRLAPGRRRGGRGDRPRARGRALRAARGGGAGPPAPPRRHARRRLLDAGARRGDVLSGARGSAAGALQPGRQRHRRDGVHRLRSGRGDAPSRSCC